ncbi:MAG: nucleoside hydrolase, partial [Ktedonobacterales bacterium]
MPAVLIDTDIGDDIDDALALALALRSPELELLGVSTVFGDVALRARLARKVLVTFGRPDILVAEGIGVPLARRNRPSGCIQGAAVAHDEPLPPPYPGDAATLIAETALARPGQVTLICLGPLTNIATALDREPRLASALAGVVMMGSATFPWAEWNTRNDPEAARIVLRSGMPIYAVGLNVTLICTLSRDHIAALAAAGTPATDLLLRLIRLWQRGNPRRRLMLHDPLTVAAVARPELLQPVPARFGIVANGPLRGWTCVLPWPDGRQRVALSVRRARFLRLFRERVIGTSLPAPLPARSGEAEVTSPPTPPR